MDELFPTDQPAKINRDTKRNKSFLAMLLLLICFSHGILDMCHVTTTTLCDHGNFVCISMTQSSIGANILHRIVIHKQLTWSQIWVVGIWHIIPTSIHAYVCIQFDFFSEELTLNGSLIHLMSYNDFKCSFFARFSYSQHIHFVV